MQWNVRKATIVERAADLTTELEAGGLLTVHQVSEACYWHTGYDNLNLLP